MKAKHMTTKKTETLTKKHPKKLEMLVHVYCRQRREMKKKCASPEIEKKTKCWCKKKKDTRNSARTHDINFPHKAEKALFLPLPTTYILLQLLGTVCNMQVHYVNNNDKGPLNLLLPPSPQSRIYCEGRMSKKKTRRLISEEKWDSWFPIIRTELCKNCYEGRKKEDKLRNKTLLV